MNAHEIHCPTGAEQLERLTGEPVDSYSKLWEEYCKCLRFFHAGGGTGPLPLAIVITVLRNCSVDPKPFGHDSKAASDKSLASAWMEVEEDSPVSIKLETGETVTGQFKGVGSGGKLLATYGGDGWVHEFPAHRVTKAENPYPELDRDSLLGSERESDPRSKQVEAEGAGEPDWESITSGTRIIIKKEGQGLAYGEFVEQEDNGVLVMVGDELETVDEAQVTLAP